MLRHLELHIFLWFGALAMEAILPTELVRCLHRIKERGNLRRRGACARRCSMCSSTPSMCVRWNRPETGSSPSRVAPRPKKRNAGRGDPPCPSLGGQSSRAMFLCSSTLQMLSTKPCSGSCLDVVLTARSAGFVTQ